MVVSSRGILAIGLGLTGLAFLVGPSLGQQQDGAVRKTASPTAGAAAPGSGRTGHRHGRHRLVFKSYEKFKVANKEFNAAMLARKNELMKIMSEAQEEAQMLTKLTPGTEDYKKHENRVTELKARHEAGREQAQREFALRDAENVATIYKEVQAMVVRIAKWRKMNYVVKISNQPISGTDPNSVMTAISEHDGLRRPGQRHHQRRDLQPESHVQGHRRPRAQGPRMRPLPRRPSRPTPPSRTVN